MKTKRKTKPIDWNLIEVEYTTGTASLRALAKKYKVGDNTIGTHSKRDGWVTKRLQYRGKVVASTVDERGKVAILDKTAFDTKASRITDRMMAYLDKAIPPGADTRAIIDTLTRAIEAKYKIWGIHPTSKVESKVTATVEAELSLEAQLTLMVIFADSQLSSVYAESVNLLRDEGKCYNPRDASTEHLCPKSELKIYVAIMQERMKSQRKANAEYATRRMARQKQDAAKGNGDR